MIRLTEAVRSLKIGMMIAKREVWKYPEAVKVWVGKYRHSHNLLHWHPDCELLYVEKGSIDVFCERQTHRLTRGEALYIDGGRVHYMSACEADTTLIVIIFDYEILKPYLGEVRLLHPRLRGNYDIPAVYRTVRDILLRKAPFCGLDATAHIMLLMADIFRGEEVAPRPAQDETDKRFMSLIEQVAEKPECFTFSDAASFMGMSAGYFSRYFHSATGLTFSGFLNYARVEHAIELMRTKEYTMTEIADRAGFGTVRNFNRVFHAVTGYSPRTLPESFRLRDDFVYPMAAPFDPTLHDCELLESAGR